MELRIFTIWVTMIGACHRARWQRLKITFARFRIKSFAHQTSVIKGFSHVITPTKSAIPIVRQVITRVGACGWDSYCRLKILECRLLASDKAWSSAIWTLQFEIYNRLPSVIFTILPHRRPSWPGSIRHL